MSRFTYMHMPSKIYRVAACQVNLYFFNREFCKLSGKFESFGKKKPKKKTKQNKQKKKKQIQVQLMSEFIVIPSTILVQS